MFYRLSPPADLTWTDLPVRPDRIEEYIQQGAEFDKLDWAPTEDRKFSAGMLRIALRHGFATGRGLIVHAQHTVDLGRSDQLRINQQAIDENQAKIRAQYGEFFERIMPGWTESGEELDARVRQSTERVAREADEDLAEVLAAPVKPELAEHWVRLGGDLPD